MGAPTTKKALFQTTLFRLARAPAIWSDRVTPLSLPPAPLSKKKKVCIHSEKRDVSYPPPHDSPSPCRYPHYLSTRRLSLGGPGRPPRRIIHLLSADVPPPGDTEV
ncbi:unnamed protein product [Cyprideis torosa]|uniref:Uncharacterized protein n=1 Tax=Cyprideis torosa TaxID=163714 RepID=A0A7R8W552_9CRUS|nr:unnamed protein product [Cyprideis torosa]CAG0884894.1 unnamed protein product [Cyprideis torosa]